MYGTPGLAAHRLRTGLAILRRHARAIVQVLLLELLLLDLVATAGTACLELPALFGKLKRLLVAAALGPLAGIREGVISLLGDTVVALFL